MTTIQWILCIAWFISVAIVIICNVSSIRSIGITIFDCPAKNGYTVGMLIKDILWGSTGSGILVVGLCLIYYLIKGFCIAIIHVSTYLDEHVFSKRLF
jgi:hypothetical protein